MLECYRLGASPSDALSRVGCGAERLPELGFLDAFVADEAAYNHDVGDEGCC